MERIEPTKEEWVPIGTDDDGTHAFLDAKNVTQELDSTTVFKAWLKHVPPSGSRTYSMMLSLLKRPKKNHAAPDHIRQVVEIDCAKERSRTLHLVVCDKQDRLIDVINFRYPEWVDIAEKSILDKAKSSIKEAFPESTRIEHVPLKFRRPRTAGGMPHVRTAGSSSKGGSNGADAEHVEPAARTQPTHGKPLLPHAGLKLQSSDPAR
jgi:hypothetical protein